MALELDAQLSTELDSALSDRPSVTVVEGDAREFDPAEHFEPGYKIVANLPYYAATPIIRRYLTIEPRPADLVVMVQSEVANRMAAAPGRMSFLSVVVQLHASATVLFSVQPRAFRPTPKVTSAVVKLVPHVRPVLSLGDPDAFISFVAGGFRAPRKQIRNSLRIGLEATAGEVDEALESAGVDERRRPATLSLEEWGNLYGAWGRAAEC